MGLEQRVATLEKNQKKLQGMTGAALGLAMVALLFVLLMR